MSNLHLNRRKPIRLPFSTPLKSTHLNQVEQTDCGMSVPQHVQCSEPFYAASIRESIAQNPSSSEAEKKGMFKILERFERGDENGGTGEDDEEEVVGNGIGAGKLEDLYRGLIGEGEGGGQDDDEDDEHEEEDEAAREELVRRLEGVDLDSLAPQDLFALLPASHRKRFVGILQSEQSRAKLVQDAQEDDGNRDEEGEDDERDGEVAGWWTPTGMALRLEEDDTDDAGTETEAATNKPKLMDEASTAKIAIPPSVVEGLRFNLLTICLAYIILIKILLPRTRTIQNLLSSRPTERKKRKIDESKAILRGLVGFLFDPKSVWKARGMRDVEDAVQGGVDDDTEVANYLQDLADLIRPPLDMTEMHPAQLALSDLHALFSFEPDWNNKNKQVLKKLEFYYTLAGLIGRPGWLALERAMQTRMEKLRLDEEGDGKEIEKEEPLLVDDDVPIRRVDEGNDGGKIAEL